MSICRVSRQDVSNKATNRIKDINRIIVTNHMDASSNKSKTSLHEIPIIAILAIIKVVEDLQADQKSNKHETLCNY